MKKIFIASSHECKELVNQIKNFLDSRQHGIECVTWMESFNPGSLTFEALENVLSECAGAVFVTTPEGKNDKDGKPGQPNENVILELGLVAARLGRPSVALCRYDQVVLPTDLEGFTHIEMGPSRDKDEKFLNLTADAQVRLTSWVGGLTDMIAGVPRTQVVHGCSGVWLFDISFTKWRKIDIEQRSFAILDGQLHLFIPVDGTRGSGVAQGELELHLEDPTSHEKGVYNAHYNVDAHIKIVRCHDDGSMTLISRTHARQLFEPSGKPWPNEGLDPSVFGPWYFTWDLKPDEKEEARFQVNVNSGNWSSGTGTAVKI
jgi:hypothetical protein